MQHAVPSTTAYRHPLSLQLCAVHSLALQCWRLGCAGSTDPVWDQQLRVCVCVCVCVCVVVMLTCPSRVPIADGQKALSMANTLCHFNVTCDTQQRAARGTFANTVHILLECMQGGPGGGGGKQTAKSMHVCERTKTEQCWASDRPKAREKGQQQASKQENKQWQQGKRSMKE